MPASSVPVFSVSVVTVTVDEIGLPSASYSVVVVFVSVTGLPSSSVEVVFVSVVSVEPVLFSSVASPS